MVAEVDVVLAQLRLAYNSVCHRGPGVPRVLLDLNKAGWLVGGGYIRVGRVRGDLRRGVSRGGLAPMAQRDLLFSKLTLLCCSGTASVHSLLWCSSRQPVKHAGTAAVVVWCPAPGLKHDHLLQLQLPERRSAWAYCCSTNGTM